MASKPLLIPIKVANGVLKTQPQAVNKKITITRLRCQLKSTTGNVNSSLLENLGLKIINNTNIIKGNNKANMGMPHLSQSAKLNPAADAAIALGGLPINVAMPPRFPEYASPSKTKTYTLDWFFLCRLLAC